MIPLTKSSSMLWSKPGVSSFQSRTTSGCFLIFFITRNTQLVTRNIISQNKHKMLSEIGNKLSIFDH